MRLVSNELPPEAVFSILHDVGMGTTQSSIAPGDLYRGPLAPAIMAPFLAPFPSRFSDGSFGVLYAAYDLPTAVTEHGYHLARFAAQTAAPASVFHRMHIAIETRASLRDLRRDDARLFDPNDYRFAQQRGAALREQRLSAIVYPSVRRKKGVCAGFFIPRAVDSAALQPAVAFAWTGKELEAFTGPVAL